MSILKPDEFHPALRESRLAQVANWLLEEWYATEDDLVRETDGPYTRGTTRFGRQKQRITNEYFSGTHDWLGMENSGLDLVFSIGGIPCRFSNDSATEPTKRAVLEAHRFQIPLIEESQPDSAARFCFVIDRGANESETPRVTLLGYSSMNVLVCRWTSTALLRVLSDTKATRPEAIDIPKPRVTPKRPPVNDEGAASAEP